MKLSNYSWLIFLPIVAASSLRAAEITGTIRGRSGDSVSVAVEGNLVPNAGDKAEIFFKLAGADDEISVATGSVAKVEADSVQLKIEKATGDVAKDQLVRITSANPQKRISAASGTAPSKSPPQVSAEATTAASPPPSPSTTQAIGRDPSFAFVDMRKIFDEHPKTKESERQINAAKNAAQKEYEKRVAAKQSGLDDWRAEQERQLQAQSLKFRDEIVAEIKEKIEEAGAETGDLVFDISGNSQNGIPFVLYFPGGAEMSTHFDATRGLQVGVVDMDSIFRRAKKTEQAEAEINASKAAAKQEYERRAASSKKNEQELSSFRAAKEKELGEQAAALRGEIVTEIVSTLRAMVKGESSALIFDASGQSSNGVPFVVVKRSLPDLSDDIVTTLNGGASRTTAAPLLPASGTLRIACVDMLRATAGKEALERVRQLAETEQFDLVFDSGAQSSTGVPVLLSTREIPDLTDDVVAHSTGSAK